MPLFASRSARNRAIVIQVAVVAGLLAFYALGLPMIRRAHARSEAAGREARIAAFFQAATVEAGQPPAQARRLRLTPQADEVEQRLGAPDVIAAGYGGTQVLTWKGTRHKLEASFNNGQLYALTMTDLKTGHGEQVLESSAQWRAL